jgi:hypothetical protein
MGVGINLVEVNGNSTLTEDAHNWMAKYDHCHTHIVEKRNCSQPVPALRPHAVVCDRVKVILT